MLTEGDVAVGRLEVGTLSYVVTALKTDIVPETKEMTHTTERKSPKRYMWDTAEIDAPAKSRKNIN